MKKYLILFNSNGIESARFEIPPFYVKCGLDYAYTLWKYNKLRKKDPEKFDSWDTETVTDVSANN